MTAAVEIEVAEFQSDLYPVELVVATTAEKMKVAARHLGMDLPANLKLGATAFKEGCKNVICVFVDGVLSPDEFAVVAAHEATHVKQLIAKIVGEDQFGEETEAYIIQWAVGCILAAKNWKSEQEHPHD